MQIDWGRGSYEGTAARLEEAARVAVDAAAPGAGERVVDVGCGTGNAALLAAARGARVTGVDPATRLLDVARARAAERGVEVAFVPGDAARLPLDDAGADVVLSVFGAVFAPDAEAAAEEMARVLGPRGRIVLTAWIPDGPIADVVRFVSELVTRTLQPPPSPPPFPWHDAGALTSLLAPHGFRVAVRERRIAFVAPSARAYVEDELDGQPVFLAALGAVATRGVSREAFAGPILDILEAGNEDAGGFRVTSRYVVATARRQEPC